MDANLGMRIPWIVGIAALVKVGGHPWSRTIGTACASHQADSSSF
jgi:hypothetical protein